MRFIARVLFFLSLIVPMDALYGQSISPRQITPSDTNGDVLTTVGGATAWVPASVTTPVSVAHGGTGATTPTGALQNLGPDVYAANYYSGSGFWDTALASCDTAARAAAVWCLLPSIVVTQNTFVAYAGTHIRPASWHGGESTSEATYGTLWYSVPSTSGVDVISTNTPSSILHDVQIEGIFFDTNCQPVAPYTTITCASSPTTFNRSALNLNFIFGLSVQDVGIGGPATQAHILGAGWQKARLENITLLNSNTTYSAPAAIEMLGLESSGIGSAPYSTTTQFRNVSIDGNGLTTGGIGVGFLFDNDSCTEECITIGGYTESTSGQGVVVGAGTSVEFYSLAIENTPDANVSTGLIQIGYQLQASHTYTSTVNFIGGNFGGWNYGTATLNELFDIGQYANKINIYGVFASRFASFEYNAGACTSCMMNISSTWATMNYGFGPVGNPINFNMVGDGNRFNSNYYTADMAYPVVDAQFGTAAQAPPYYNAPGQLFYSSDQGPQVYNPQACGGFTVTIVASAGGITSATPTITGNPYCLVGDMIYVIQSGASLGVIQVATLSGTAPATFTVSSAGSGYSSQSGLSIYGKGHYVSSAASSVNSSFTINQPGNTLGLIENDLTNTYQTRLQTSSAGTAILTSTSNALTVSQSAASGTVGVYGGSGGSVDLCGNHYTGQAGVCGTVNMLDGSNHIYHVFTSTAHTLQNLTTATNGTNYNPPYVNFQGNAYSTSAFGSVTGVSGGSGFSGSGTIFLTSFNNGCSGTTATVTLASGAFSSAVVTNVGSGCTSAPTSATCTSGTATCTGSPVSITVATTLGASQTLGYQWKQICANTAQTPACSMTLAVSQSANLAATFSADLSQATAGTKVDHLSVASARKGTFVCTAGGSIVVSNSNYVSTSDVVITMNTAGGTITTPPAFKTTSTGTGFTMLCGATDTSTYNYDILN